MNKKNFSLKVVIVLLKSLACIGIVGIICTVVSIISRTSMEDGYLVIQDSDRIFFFFSLLAFSALVLVSGLGWMKVDKLVG